MQAFNSDVNIGPDAVDTTPGSPAPTRLFCVHVGLHRIVLPRPGQQQRFIWQTFNQHGLVSELHREKKKRIY